MKTLKILALILTLALTYCQTEPAPRVIRSLSPAIFQFIPQYQYLIDNVAINIDSTGILTHYTDPYDNRWYRPNKFTYSEQITYTGLYFTNITQKEQFDYNRINGTLIPPDTLKARIFAVADTVLLSFYQAHERSGGAPLTVEFFDEVIKTGQLIKYAQKLK